MSIRFLLNDAEVRTDSPPGTALLDFIRRERRMLGTKIGCREGDCGACTVLVGELYNGRLSYRSMTSCLMPLGNASGRHIVTIEGLNCDDLTPVQRALADHGGTQCGFCTVGFVVSLSGYCMGSSEPSPENAVIAVDGNICRCTGYKSIERACHDIAGFLSERDKDDRLKWLVDNRFLPEYFRRIPERMERMLAETTAAEQAPALDGSTTLVGGGTDLLVQKPEAMPGSSLQLTLHRTELNQIRTENGFCRAGGSVTAEQLRHSEAFFRMFPRIREYLKLVSSTPIRNMGTIAGNFVNASPIGDLTIFFLALDAELVLHGSSGIRTLPLRKFYKGYKDLDLNPGEYVEEVRFRVPGEGFRYNFEKVSKRTHLDIASVNSAMRVETEGDTIKSASVSAGGVAPTPFYLAETSQFLKGKTVDADVVREAGRIAQGEVSPISDARGSAEYKRLLLKRLVYAHFLRCFPEKSELEALV